MIELELDLTRATEFTKEMGLHSGYPECCVDYFIQIWTTLERLEKLERIKLLKKSEWEHIPCNECLVKNNKIIGHNCNSECYKYFTEKYEFYRVIKNLKEPTLILDKQTRH